MKLILLLGTRIAINFLERDLRFTQVYRFMTNAVVVLE